MNPEGTVKVESIKVHLDGQWIFLRPDEARKLCSELLNVFGDVKSAPVSENADGLWVNPNAEPMPFNWLVNLSTLRQTAVLQINIQ